MKVLMFGWEYPPHILGGLGTASFGITEGLHAQGDVDITFCLPKPWGDEDKEAAHIVARCKLRVCERADWQCDGTRGILQSAGSHLRRFQLYERE